MVFAETFVMTVIAPETVAPDAGDVMETVGGAVTVFLTVIETAALVTVCAAALLATAVIEWVAFESAAVFSERLKGALVTAAPELLPSTLNCTLTVFAETFAATVIAPETVAPEAGDVIETVGRAVTVFLTVIETAVLVAVCAAALLATALIEWVALESAAVFSERLKGAAVTAAPELLPSTLNCTLVVFAETFVATLIVPATVAPGAGDVMETVGGAVTAFLTVIETAALVTVWPSALLATAAIEWVALDSVAVFSERLKGADATAAPELLPSTWNCTLMVFADTFVATVIAPETVAPEAGDVIETVGGAVTAFLTVIETAALVAVCPSALLATAVNEWVALERVAVLRERLNGAAVTAAPELLPSTLNCTLVVFEETLVATLRAPVTVAPVAGEVMDTVGAAEGDDGEALLLFALVRPVHPVTNSVRITGR
jgi:hypothetical protein